MTNPVHFSPSVEVPEKEEAETQAELIESLLSISRTTLKDELEPLRAVHAKSHGLIRARFVVLDGLPPAYAQGLSPRCRHGISPACQSEPYFPSALAPISLATSSSFRPLTGWP
jgi:hypothetical protein